MSEQTIPILLLLVARLERLSADSRWSYRSSGLRGSILKMLDNIETDEAISLQIDKLIKIGFNILVESAHQIPDPVVQRDH